MTNHVDGLHNRLHGSAIRILQEEEEKDESIEYSTRNDDKFHSTVSKYSLRVEKNTPAISSVLCVCFVLCVFVCVLCFLLLLLLLVVISSYTQHFETSNHSHMFVSFCRISHFLYSTIPKNNQNVPPHKQQQHTQKQQQHMMKVATQCIRGFAYCWHTTKKCIRRTKQQLHNTKQQQHGSTNNVDAYHTTTTRDVLATSRCRYLVVLLISVWSIGYTTVTLLRHHNHPGIKDDTEPMFVHSQTMMAFAHEEFRDHPKLIFVNGTTTDDDLRHFIEETDIGQSSLHYDIPRWVLPFSGTIWGYKGRKPTCTTTNITRDHNHHNNRYYPNTNRRTTLFYLLTSADDRYVYQLQLSICTARESNPTLPITVGIQPGYLRDTHQLSALLTFLTNHPSIHHIVCFEPLEYGYDGPSKNAHFRKNWLRLRIWELDPYFDTILYVDADTAIRKQVSTLLSWQNIPFASASDMDKVGILCYSSFGTLQGGVLLIQPCRSIFLHMRALLEHTDISAFTKDHAEQTFLDWYWRFDGVRFGYGYNFIASVARKYQPTVVGSLRKMRRRRRGGGDGGVVASSETKVEEEDLTQSLWMEDPAIVHYTVDKITRDSDLSRPLQELVRDCHEKTRVVVPDLGLV